MVKIAWSYSVNRFWDIGRAENRQFCLPWPWSPGQGSLKVIDFDTNGKRVYIFPLVINSNFSPILHRFGDMRLKVLKSPILPTPPSFNAPDLGEPLRISGWNLLSKTRGMGLPYGENCVILASTVFDWSTRVTDGRTDRRTDRRTDGRQHIRAIA